MNLFQSPEDRETELLSAYIDNALPPGERLKLEARLAVDVKLRRTLNELRRVKTGLADLPRVKPPRNFTLTPTLAGEQARRSVSPLIPALNWATTVAAILFVAVISLDLLRAPNAAAPVAQTESQAFTAQTEAPAADVAPQVALAPNASLKSTTATPDSTLRVLTAPSAEAGGGLGETEPYGYGYSGAEPLTGGAGDSGTGGGVPGVAGTDVPPLANSATLASETPVRDETEVTVDQTTLTDGSATAVANVPETTAPEVAPAPAENVQVANAPTQSEGPDTLRLAQIVLGLALIGLITTSFILRRR